MHGTSQYRRHTTAGTNPDTGLPFDVHIELDGCRRILADGFDPHVAPCRLPATLDAPDQ